MREPPSVAWTYIGNHCYRFEPPDIFMVRINGDVSANDFRTELDAFQSLAREQGRSLFWLSDVKNMGVLMPDARRLVMGGGMDGIRPIVRATAIVGASFATRVLVDLLHRAVRTLRPGTAGHVLFAQTEAEARAFFETQRQDNRAAP